MIDLHTHSNASDGSLSPRELLATADSLGLSVLALTDHDTTAGLAEAEAAAGNIVFIPGVEIEIPCASGEFHLLGLGISRHAEEIDRRLQELRVLRDQRNQEIIRLFNVAGIECTYEEAAALAGGEVVGRLHLARLLVRKGRCRSMEEAFRTHLGQGCPFYVPRRSLDFPEAARLIREAGGLSVLAHPLSLKLGWAALREKLGDLAAAGLDGIEAYHSNASLRECRRLESMAAELGLVVSAGSDYHGENRRDRVLGKTCEGLPIDDRYAQAFLPSAVSGLREKSR